MRNYTRALHVELKDRGISATAVCPGWLKTDLYDRADIGAVKATSNFFGMTAPDRIARKAVAGKDLSIYGLYVNFCHIGAKLLPQRAVMKIWLRQQRIDPYSRPSQQ